MKNSFAPGENRPPPTRVRPVPCTIISRDQAFVIPSRAHTLAGFRAWATSDKFPERVRASFIDGEIILDCRPEELETHNKVKLELYGVLLALVKEQKTGQFYPSGTLFSNTRANLSTEPDAFFAAWESLESGRARLVPRKGVPGQYMEVEGAPDWVLEVVSKTSVGKDTKRLRERYHRAGIPEYWLIDARGEDISFQILLREKDAYAPSEGRAGWQASRVFRRRFRLTRTRGRMGFWDYTLQVRPLT